MITLDDLASRLDRVEALVQVITVKIGGLSMGAPIVLTSGTPSRFGIKALDASGQPTTQLPAPLVWAVSNPLALAFVVDADGMAVSLSVVAGFTEVALGNLSVTSGPLTDSAPVTQPTPPPPPPGMATSIQIVPVA